jgi:SAM-dependent methyltransferase
MIKALLKQVPGMVRTYRQWSHIKMVARERWFTDRRSMNDTSHLTREWNFEAPAEQDRYERVLDLVIKFKGTTNLGDVLEVGCAEGLFTERLIKYCQKLTVCDISPVACARTKERLLARADLRVAICDLDFDPLPGIHDVVFAMDVLEFVHGRDRLARVGRRLAAALRPGGTLVISVCRLPEILRRCWWSPIFPEGADNILDFLSNRFGLQPVERKIHSVPDQEAHGYIEHLIAIFKKVELLQDSIRTQA